MKAPNPAKAKIEEISIHPENELENPVQGQPAVGPAAPKPEQAAAASNHPTPGDDDGEDERSMDFYAGHESGHEEILATVTGALEQQYASSGVFDFIYPGTLRAYFENERGGTWVYIGWQTSANSEATDQKVTHLGYAAYDDSPGMPLIDKNLKHFDFQWLDPKTTDKQKAFRITMSRVETILTMFKSYSSQPTRRSRSRAGESKLNRASQLINTLIGDSNEFGEEGEEGEYDRQNGQVNRPGEVGQFAEELAEYLDGMEQIKHVITSEESNSQADVFKIVLRDGTCYSITLKLCKKWGQTD